MQTDSPHRLSNATSPYLQQHADNPVDWWPWCEEALALARVENKPILLSIGYSACHWCHVMAHESFEDEKTAELMNRLFVNIKVDREQRPDLDRIYQSAHQLLSRRAGGWPLTMFLSPHDRVPFFCGTYFPREPHYGLPSFKEILLGVAEAYRQQPDAIEAQSRDLQEALQQLAAADAKAPPLTDAPFRLAWDQLRASFDKRYGGFGGAPKFPHTTSLEWLLVHWVDVLKEGQPDEQALHMVQQSLSRMALGGIHDQLGGGFFRYSVDERWEIPHFEKMLYDNGLLLSLYCAAWQATEVPLFRRVIEQTADWVMKEMQAPEGGYYSSLDADSEGGEGDYYVWSQEELAASLSEAEYNIFRIKFGLDAGPNFEGRWHLHSHLDDMELAELCAMDVAQLNESLGQIRAQLYQVRTHRPRPGCDDKILTAWNGLMIKGMARAARLLERDDLQASAEQALTFIHDRLWRDGRLFACWRAGRAELKAYLDDYAFLLDALLEMLQLRWSDRDLAFAREVADSLLDHFEDAQGGGFFFTADDHETLIQRPKPWTDDAMPSGNGVAAYALNRLGHLVGEPRYLDAAQRVLEAAQPLLEGSPSACGALLLAARELMVPPEIVIIQGGDAKARAHWLRCTQRGYAPHRLTVTIPSQSQGLGGVAGSATGVVARICRGTLCLPPVTVLGDFESQFPGMGAS